MLTKVPANNISIDDHKFRRASLAWRARRPCRPEKSLRAIEPPAVTARRTNSVTARRTDAVTDQSEVDDLLASLGF